MRRLDEILANGKPLVGLRPGASLAPSRGRDVVRLRPSDLFCVGFGGDFTSVDLEGFNYFVANPVPGEVTKVGDDSAFIGGGQLGYNYAFNNIVAGIEADLSGFDLQAAKIPNSSRADWGSDTRVSVEMNWLATVRGRLGVAMDRWLLYGTGGVAFSDGEYRNHDFCNTLPACGGGLIDAKGDMDTGWTVGGGAEFAWMANWTAKAEYLFVRFDGEEYSGTANYLHPHPPKATDSPLARQSSTSSGLASTTNSAGATRRL